MSHRSSPYWVIGLMISIIAVLSLFFPWFEAQVLFSSASYNATDMAFGSPFQEGGFWEDFDSLGRYCPLIFGILGIINALLFCEGRSRRASKVIILMSLLMIALPIYTFTCIDPGSGTGWMRDAGMGIYIGVILGIFSTIFGYLASKA